MTAQSMLQVQLKKLHHLAVVPKFQTEGAAGFDLHAVIQRNDEKFGLIEAIEIPPGKSARINTGIAVSINNPAWGLFLYSRSGMGAKEVRLGNCVGVIDSDYQGELLVMLRNDSDQPFVVSHGDRIAQGVFTPVSQANFIEVEDFSVETKRGANGFGSTGS